MALDAKTVSAISKLSRDASIDLLDECVGVGSHDGQDDDALREVVMSACQTGAVSTAKVFEAIEAESESALAAEADWGRIVREQGWNEASQIIHLEGFLRQNGLFPKFATYAQTVAGEESADIAGDPRLEVLEDLGYDIDEDSDQPGMWIWTAPTDGCETSYPSAQDALAAAWADAAAQTMGIRNLSGEQWEALGLARQMELVADTLSRD
jgi:hypothetical protein